MRKHRRNIIFLVTSVLFYLLWVNGGESIYAKFVSKGIEKFTSKISSIESVDYKHFEKEKQTLIYCNYADRKTTIAMEFCLPIVLLLAWHFALFFEYRITKKKALQLFTVNFSIVYFFQILFPLLLFNISQSIIKAMGLFIGLQIVGFLVFFLILKDSLIIKYKFLLSLENQAPTKGVTIEK
jgi:hypothetical protein